MYCIVLYRRRVIFCYFWCRVFSIRFDLRCLAKCCWELVWKRRWIKNFYSPSFSNQCVGCLTTCGTLWGWWMWSSTDQADFICKGEEDIFRGRYCNTGDVSCLPPRKIKTEVKLCFVVAGCGVCVIITSMINCCCRLVVIAEWFSTTSSLCHLNPLGIWMKKRKRMAGKKKGQLQINSRTPF